ncbi:MAG: hypothetical protein WCB02_38030 [Bradyrhizobium sp.]
MSAFTGKSAARADPDTIASAVANKTNFFIEVPTTFFEIAAPRTQAKYDCDPIFSTKAQFGTRRAISEAKNASICPLFNHFGISAKGCRQLLHSDNNFGAFRQGNATISKRSGLSAPRSGRIAADA